jgi:short-subunit dehydrogenase
MKVTLITGASGGIGEAISNRLAAKKQNLLLIARNAQKLEEQCARLSNSFGIDVQYIAADLSNPDAAFNIFSEVETRGMEVDILINNAGIGSGGQFSTLSLKAELNLIQLNISSLLTLTHLFLPQMQQKKSGTIVNISSMASFMPVPYMATYAASKAFVRHLHKLLHRSANLITYTSYCSPQDSQKLSLMLQQVLIMNVELASNRIMRAQVPKLLRR